MVQQPAICCVAIVIAQRHGYSIDNFAQKSKHPGGQRGVPFDFWFNLALYAIISSNTGNGKGEMYTDVISKPVYQILSDLTQESRLEVALPLAIKDWVRLKLKEASERRETFERRYGMEFQAFKQAWTEGRIENNHSYEVEHDYWEWEATVTDEERLHHIVESLL